MSKSRKGKKPSRANGTDPAQQEIPETAEANEANEAAAPPQGEPGKAAAPPEGEPGGAAAPPEGEPGKAAAPPTAVVELGNTGKGCWKLLADGKRVKLSDEDWRKELARVFSRQLPVP